MISRDTRVAGASKPLARTSEPCRSRRSGSCRLPRPRLTCASGLLPRVDQRSDPFGLQSLGRMFSGYFEDEALTGKDEFGDRAQDFTTKELAFTLGGPVVRDRAAFFVDLGLQREVIPQSEPEIGTDTTGGADSAGVGIRYASVQRFQQILRDRYGVEAGTFDAAPFRVARRTCSPRSHSSPASTTVSSCRTTTGMATRNLPVTASLQRLHAIVRRRVWTRNDQRDPTHLDRVERRTPVERAFSGAPGYPGESAGEVGAPRSGRWLWMRARCARASRPSSDAPSPTRTSGS